MPDELKSEEDGLPWLYIGLGVVVVIGFGDFGESLSVISLMMAYKGLVRGTLRRNAIGMMSYHTFIPPINSSIDYLFNFLQHLGTLLTLLSQIVILSFPAFLRWSPFFLLNDKTIHHQS